MNVIIVRPKGNTGGSLVLEKMCSLFREKGVNASLFYIMNEPNKDTIVFKFWLNWLYYNFKWNLFYILCNCFPNSMNERIRGWKPIVISPVKGIKRKLFPFYNKNRTIVIYPEKVYGNFLHAKHVVRYFLYYYKYSGDYNAYSQNDLFIAFREVFNDWNLNKEGHVVTISHFDNSLYKQYNFGERKGNCYIVRKGKNRPDLPKYFDGPIIDDLIEEEKVKIFNKCQRCFFYDTQTFYTSIAAVCGCLPIVIMEQGKSLSDYCASSEDHLGVAYGDTTEEIEYALKTREQLINRLDYRERNEKNIVNLIEILKARFSL